MWYTCFRILRPLNLNFNRPKTFTNNLHVLAIRLITIISPQCSVITWYCAACPAWLTCLPASPQPLSPVPGLQLPRSLTSEGSWPPWPQPLTSSWPPPGVSGSSSWSRSDLETPDSVSLQHLLRPRHDYSLPLPIILLILLWFLRWKFDFQISLCGGSDADWGMCRHTLDDDGIRIR